MGFFLGDSYIGNIPEAVSGLITSDEEQDERISDLEEKVRQALASVFVYKGSVASYSDLPADDNKVGDTYNVLDTGDNYTWNGTGWDKLAGIVDLSNLVTLDTAQTITGIKTFEDTPIKLLTDHGDERSIYTDQGGIVFDSEGSGSVAMDYMGSFYPVSGNYKYLGYSTEKWARAYIEKYFDGNNASYGYTLPDSTSLTADSELVDTASNQTITGNKKIADNVMLNFGTLEQIRSSSGALRFYHSSNEMFRIGNNDVVISASLYRAQTTNTTDLGSSSYAWKDLYLAGTITYSTNTSISYDSNYKVLLLRGENGVILNTSGSPIQFNRSISYSSDNTKDIGTSTVRTRNLYLAGNLSDGTNDVTVADLAALIAYAKTQGWIS